MPLIWRRRWWWWATSEKTTTNTHDCCNYRWCQPCDAFMCAMDSSIFVPLPWSLSLKDFFVLFFFIITRQQNASRIRLSVDLKNLFRYFTQFNCRETEKGENETSFLAFPSLPIKKKQQTFLSSPRTISLEGKEAFCAIIVRQRLASLRKTRNASRKKQYQALA